MKSVKSLCVLAFALGAAAGPVAAGEVTLEVAAENSYSDYYKTLQQPYFEETLPSITDGRVKANAVPFDQLGLSGFELMRLLERRTLDIVTGTLSYVTQDYPALEGGSLAALSPDLDSFKEIYGAYRPVLDEIFETKYNSKILMIYSWPQSRIFCSIPGKPADEVTFADLEGKSIRSFGATVSDLLEGIGAKPITMAFAEVPAAIQRGTLDCFASSIVGAYQSKAYQVLTHMFDLNVNYAAQFVAINIDSFNQLSAEDQAILESSMKELEAAMLAHSGKLEVDIPLCLTAGPCEGGEAAGLTNVVPTEADRARIKDVVENTVVTRWADRCGSQDCLDAWNATVGKVLEITVTN